MSVKFKKVNEGKWEVCKGKKTVGTMVDLGSKYIATLINGKKVYGVNQKVMKQLITDALNI